VEFHTHGIKY